MNKEIIMAKMCICMLAISILPTMGETGLKQKNLESFLDKVGNFFAEKIKVKY